MNIGNRLKQLRKDHDLTLDQLSKKTGVAKSTLSEIENGNADPHFRTVERITFGLGLSVQVLFNDAPSSSYLSRLVENMSNEDKTKLYQIARIMLGKELEPVDLIDGIIEQKQNDND